MADTVDVSEREPDLANDASKARRRTFADIYGERKWNDIFADQTPVEISDPEVSWLHLPPQSFVDYLVNRPPLSFEGVPPDPSQYKRPPTFPITQIHRLWVTIREVQRHLGNSDVVLDLGAFPFSLDIILREYIGFAGYIFATVNIGIRDEWKAELDRYRVETRYLNLDPYVHDGGQVPGIEDRLALDDASVDFVILAHVIEHLYHPARLLKEVFRVLKPGGRFLVSSDNAFMLSTLLHLCSLGPFLHEPVEQTSAMSFHFWRGHNRFFTEMDMVTMLRAAGFDATEGSFYEVLYNSFSEQYFLHPTASIPRWRADILSSIPAYRNEIVVLAQKDKSARSGGAPR